MDEPGKKGGTTTQHRQTSETDEIRISGLRSKGYGQLPKLLMLDSELSLGAKGIAAYFYSFTGGGSNTAFPTRDRILFDLKLHKDTYYKYLDELLVQGYLTIHRAEKNPAAATPIMSTP